MVWESFQTIFLTFTFTFTLTLTLLHFPRLAPSSNMRQPAPSWTFWFTALFLASPAVAFIAPLRARQVSDAFDWTTITPTPDLQYHSCYGTFQCARLQVPLDWSKANSTEDSDGPFAAIAIVTLPATVPVTDPAYAGPILINPGGPAGSGTDLALAAGPLVQALVDVEGERHYDILGFDPRGVKLTTPSASCYERQFDRAADELALRSMPSLMTDQGLEMKFQWYKGMAALCEGAKTADGEEVFRYLSTASVARDMLEIVERNDALVKKTAGNATVKACDAGRGGSGKARLQYLGFSYGSILGNTFASMFPGRVGRMVVDGIADAEDYMSGVSYMGCCH